MTVLHGRDAKVVAVSRHAVQLRDGRELLSEATIWTAGFRVPDLAARSGLSTDDMGRLLTDETLTSVDDARVIAAGASASPSGLPFRVSAAAARPLGAHAADTVLSRMADEKPADVDIGIFLQCASLGRGAAIVQLASSDDVANRFSLRGPLARQIEESSLTLLTEELAKEAREPGTFAWRFKDKKRRQQLGGDRASAPQRTAEAA